jgi:hypothetical protein
MLEAYAVSLTYFHAPEAIPNIDKDTKCLKLHSAPFDVCTVTNAVNLRLVLHPPISLLQTDFAWNKFFRV